MTVNTAQADAWNGPEGANWVKHSESRGATEITDALLDAAGIEPHDHVMDIGCGTGETTLLAASRAPRGRAHGVDLSEVMLERAREAAAAAGIGNATFLRGDVQAHPFALGSFTVAISRFGVMFFDDPVAAFGNVALAMRPGGRLVFVCPASMAANPWYTAPMTALCHHLGRPGLPESAMFSLADSARITTVLHEGGFADVHVRPLLAPMDFGADLATATEFYLCSGPVRGVLEQESLSPDTVRDILTEALRPYQAPQRIVIPSTNWLVVARRD
ncbi:methyltransferase domain-containing protein [Sphaerisporangium sp. B11E5]|uniref:class I SAM-dependent methyltransferase n=1 Tax=Sphaerisporangium sp. B11E5 TaxID=3153563 RepID=UPI00325C9579